MSEVGSRYEEVNRGLKDLQEEIGHELALLKVRARTNQANFRDL